jgi:hypothetical protein
MSHYANLLEDLNAAENYLEYLEGKMIILMHSSDPLDQDEADYAAWQVKEQKKLVQDIEVDIAYAQRAAA